MKLHRGRLRTRPRVSDSRPSPRRQILGGAMSQENVERLYRAYDAFNRRDLDAYLGLIDPEVELTPRIMELEGGSY
jgi:hypothetical protein